MSKALDLANIQDSGTIVSPTITGNTLFSDGAYDFDVASHDGTNGLKLGGTLITQTAALINTATQPGDVMALAIALG